MLDDLDGSESGSVELPLQLAWLGGGVREPWEEPSPNAVAPAPQEVLSRPIRPERDAPPDPGAPVLDAACPVG
jgi:hypothetical protein